MISIDFSKKLATWTCYCLFFTIHFIYSKLFRGESAQSNSLLKQNSFPLVSMNLNQAFKKKKQKTTTNHHHQQKALIQQFYKKLCVISMKFFCTNCSWSECKLNNMLIFAILVRLIFNNLTVYICCCLFMGLFACM